VQSEPNDLLRTVSRLNKQPNAEAQTFTFASKFSDSIENSTDYEETMTLMESHNLTLRSTGHTAIYFSVEQEIDHCMKYTHKLHYFIICRGTPFENNRKISFETKNHDSREQPQVGSR